MAAPSTMHNLTTLIKRLEAATSRLEDIAVTTEDSPGPSQSTELGLDPSQNQNTTQGTSRYPSDSLPGSIDEFDVLMRSSLEKYLQLSNDIGGVVLHQAREVLKGFQEQRKFLIITVKATKPQVTEHQILLKPINDVIMAVTDIKESNRSDPMYAHLSAIADGIIMLAWVTFDNRPYKHIDDCLGSAQFFGNRVLRYSRDKERLSADWIQSFYQLSRDLAAYVRQHFPSGILWNVQGGLALEVAHSISAVDAPTTTTDVSPPPPPPPPPLPTALVTAPVSDAIKAQPRDPVGGFDAVFSDLNKGAAITKRLRKVSKSEAMHKSIHRRDKAANEEKESQTRTKNIAPGKKPKPESMRAKKPAKTELCGNKWIIENHDGLDKPLEIQALLAQSVLISGCNGITVMVQGKANQVTVENSSRVCLVVESLVSTVDVVKAQNFSLQVLGSIPTVLFDNTEGAHIYLGQDSIGAKIFTSKSNGINLNILTGLEGDYKEVPLPFQICSYYDKEVDRLVNEIVSHVG